MENKNTKSLRLFFIRTSEVRTERRIRSHEMWNKRQKNLWINFLNKHTINSSILFGMRHRAWGINNALCSSWTKTVWEMKIYTYHEGQTNLLLPYATNNKNSFNSYIHSLNKKNLAMEPKCVRLGFVLFKHLIHYHTNEKCSITRFKFHFGF